jgi:hypothetical protein
MSQIKPTKKNNPCPVCDETSGKCRTTETELVLCMNTRDTGYAPTGWKFLGLTNGGGQWGKMVPSGQPESGNDRALRQQRAAERAAVDAARSARLKPAKTRHDEYAYMVANCPISETDRTDLTRRGLTDDDIRTITPVNDGKRGYIIPIRDRDGLMVGGQRRLSAATTGGKYRWATNGENHIPPTNELPLAHWQHSPHPRLIVLMDGTGVKPYLASKRLNALAIGASGGCYTSSPKTFKATLDRFSDLPIVLTPDAGDIENQSVMRRILATYQLVQSFGRDMQIGWWGQATKGDHQDIDEIGVDTEIQIISWVEFVAIAIPALEAKEENADFLVAFQSVETEGANNSTPPISKGLEGKEERKTGGDRLLEIAQTATYFHTSDKVAYADITIEGNRHTYPVRSKGFRLWLSGEYLNSTEKGIGSQTLQDTLSTLEAIAIFRGETREVNLRTADYQGKLYLDLGTDDWKAVEIDSSGWRVTLEPPVRFWRPDSLLPLPIPVTGGKLDELKDLLNVDGSAWVLIATFLLFCFCPDKTYPVLVLSAHRGSGKTAAAEIIKGLIDPGKAGLIKLQGDIRSLAAAAVNRWLMVYDNVGHISADQSDDLCRMATNFGFSTRTLHTTAEETTLEFTRPQIITAIDALVTRDDLADRVIMAQLPEIPAEKRLPQSELNAKIETAKPKILGALLTALSETLARLPDTKPESLPRMADYALFAIASEKALGLKEGEFMKTFEESREQSRQIVIESSPVGEAIVRLMEATPLIWKGTISQLLKDLENHTDEATYRSRFFPKASNMLSRQLKRLTPDLKALGLEVKEGIRSNNRETRSIVIEKVLKVSATPATPATNSPEPIAENGFSGGGYTENHPPLTRHSPESIRHKTESTEESMISGGYLSATNHVSATNPPHVKPIDSKAFNSPVADVADVADKNSLSSSQLNKTSNSIDMNDEEVVRDEC